MEVGRRDGVDGVDGVGGGVLYRGLSEVGSEGYEPKEPPLLLLCCRQSHPCAPHSRTSTELGAKF